MELLQNNNIPRILWNSFFESNNFSTPFQSPTYFDFFNSVPGFSAEVFAIKENNVLQTLCVVTFQKESGLKGFFSRRAIIYGGPLIQEGAEKTLSLLLNLIHNFVKKRVIYIETRNLNDYSRYKPQFEKAGWQFLPYLNFQLDCKTEEIIWNNLSNNRKRQINKAVRNGVEIVEAKNKNDVIIFYKILNDLYQNQIHKPLMSLQFFELFFSQNLGKYLLVKFQNKIIGGIMCPILQENTIYEWYIAGLDSEYKDESPSVMATYAAILYGSKNGLKKFDFMGAGKSGEEYGVRKFKSKFGGKLVEHGRFLKVNNSFLYKIGILGLKISSKMKR